MQNSIYVALSSQVTIAKQLESIANNIANISTIGYRAEKTTFASTIASLSSGLTHFGNTGPFNLHRTPGPAVETSNALDLMITGDAWFAIQTPEGVAYTRDGRMKISENGQLMTLAGYPVLDSNRNVIVLPSSESPKISKEGGINIAGIQTATIGLFSIPPGEKLQRGPAASVYASENLTAVRDYTDNGVIQGKLESSNVNSIEEVASLSMIQRHFESVSASIDMIDSSRVEAIRSLAPTPS